MRILTLKDKFKNKIQVYQDKAGSIQLLFGNNNIRLEAWQVEKLVGSSVYDIEDFNLDDYQKVYHREKSIK